MSMKAITYDLSAPGRDYTKLYEAIKAYGTWSHIAESVWLVVTDKTTTEIRDALKKTVDSNDRLIVFQLTSGWASLNVPKNHTDWLKLHL